MKTITDFFNEAAKVMNIFNFFEEKLDEKLEEQRDNLLYPRNDRKASIGDNSNKVNKNLNSETKEIDKKPIKIKNKKKYSDSEADSENDDSIDFREASTPTTISRQSTSETLEELKENLRELNGGKVDTNGEKELNEIIALRKKLNDPKNKNNQKNIEKEIIQKVHDSNSLPPSREQSPEHSPINSPREEKDKVKHGSKIFSPNILDKFGSFRGNKHKNKNSDSIPSSKETSPINSPRGEDEVEHGSKIFSSKSKSNKFGSIREIFKHNKNSDSVPSSKETSPMHSPREKDDKLENKTDNSKAKKSHLKSDKSEHKKEKNKHQDKTSDSVLSPKETSLINSPREKDSKLKHENKTDNSKSEIPHLKLGKSEYKKVKTEQKEKNKDSNDISPFVQLSHIEEKNYKEFGDKNSIKPKLVKSKDNYIGSVIYPGAGSKFGQPPTKPTEQEDREDTVKFSDIDPDAKSFQPLIIDFSIEDLREKATITYMGTDNKIEMESEDEYGDDVFNDSSVEEYNSKDLGSAIKPMERVDEGSIIGGSEIQRILAGDGSVIVTKAEDIH